MGFVYTSNDVHALEKFAEVPDSPSDTEGHGFGAMPNGRITALLDMISRGNILGFLRGVWARKQTSLEKFAATGTLSTKRGGVCSRQLRNLASGFLSHSFPIGTAH